MIGASLVGCTRSSLSAAWEADGAAPGQLLANDASRSDGRYPYDAGDSRDLIATDAAVNCANTQIVSRDARGICAVRCKSGAPASDVVVWVDQNSVPQKGVGDGGPVSGFLVRIVQTVPTLCDQTFSNVQTLWSGDFMNFSGQNGQWQFHLLATQSAPDTYGSSSASSDANVEVYPPGASSDSGPVDVAPTNGLSCRIFTN